MSHFTIHQDNNSVKMSDAAFVLIVHQQHPYWPSECLKYTLKHTNQLSPYTQQSLWPGMRCWPPTWSWSKLIPCTSTSGGPSSPTPVARRWGHQSFERSLYWQQRNSMCMQSSAIATYKLFANNFQLYQCKWRLGYRLVGPSFWRDNTHMASYI